MLFSEWFFVCENSLNERLGACVGTGEDVEWAMLVPDCILLFIDVLCFRCSMAVGPVFQALTKGGGRSAEEGRPLRCWLLWG